MAKMMRARGTGSLSRSKGGPYVARWTGADGRSRKRSTGTSDRRDAEAILASWLQREARVRMGLEAPGAERMILLTTPWRAPGSSRTPSLP